MPRQALPYGLKRYGGKTFEKLHASGSRCITASSLPDLFGEGRNGKMGLYAHAMGLLSLDVQESELMERGHMLQSVAAMMFEKNTGRKTRSIHARVKHPEMEFYASPDCLSMNDDSIEEPGEIKVVTPDVFEAFWGKRPPKKVLIQHQGQLLLTGASRGPIIALEVGDFTFKLHHWDIKAHPSIHATILRKTRKALDDIAANQLPPPDLSNVGDQDAIIALATGKLTDVVQLPPEARHWIDLEQRLGKMKAKIEKRRKAMKAMIVHALGDHAAGQIDDDLVELIKYDVKGGYREGYSATKLGFRSLEKIKKRAGK